MDEQNVKFLDYEIVNSGNGDGWVITKPSGKPYECHLGNFNELETAKRYCVLNFMSARPADFSAQIIARMTGSFIYHDGFKFKRVVGDENIEMPKEIGVSEDANCILTFKGEKI